MEQAAEKNRIAYTTVKVLAGIGILAAFALTSRYSYLLFHSLVELVTVLVAFVIFIIAWNTRRVLDNQYLLFIGIASLFFGSLGLAHTLSYRGIDLFPGTSDDFSVQLWMAYRYLFGISFLIAPLMARRGFRPRNLFLAYSVVTVLIFAAVFRGFFPTCYTSSGPTAFKTGSEYAIAAILFASLWLLYRERGIFDVRIHRMLSAALVASLFSALSYTQHLVITDAANMAGHFFELAANYLIYRAIVVTSVVDPSSVLFRNLRMNEEALRAAKEGLEQRVRQRTADLVRANEELQQEIGERIRAEGKLLRLAAAVEATADAVVITEPASGTVLYVNSAFERITGYSSAEVLGRTLHFLESGEHDEAYYRLMREELGRNGTWNGTMINRKKDGTFYTEECTISAVRDLSGAVTHYVYIKRDATERLRFETIQGSLRIMENIGSVFAGLRNEVGNPVNSINMVLGILRNRLSTLSEEDVQRYLDQIGGQIARVEHLLRSLKNFSLFETQNVRDVKVGAFFENFLPLVKDDFSGKGISIELRNGGAGSVLADPWALQQSLLHVLNNAADALDGRSDAAVKISVARSGGMVRIAVQDNGCGITPDRMATLFQPFRTTKANGMGLGLVIVKKMLAKMNGTVDIASTPGEGTTVSFALPEGTE